MKIPDYFRIIKGVFSFFCLFACLLALPQTVFAWPTTGQWIPLYRGGVVVQDANGDAQGSRNVVSLPDKAAMFLFNDGAYLYFRMRLDEDPTGTGGQLLLQSFGWGVEFDTNLNPANYEWLIMVDGIGDEGIDLWQNTVQGTLGSPGDQAEILYTRLPLPGNYQVTQADTSINGTPDYFLDWRFPYATFLQATGLTSYSPIRIFGGSSSSTQALTEQGADLIGASDLYAGFSDFVTPYGPKITTGAIWYVLDLAGNGDATQVAVDGTLYIRVDDADRNIDATTKQTITVVLTGPSGDTETVTLTETGINTGIFTGSIPVNSHTGIAPSNGVMQVAAPTETVTATYYDPINASYQFNQAYTDTIAVLSPVITVAKSVTPTQTPAGGTVTYTITVTNNGPAEGRLNTVTDTLPASFSYLTGTTTGLTTGNPTVSGQELTWNGLWVVPPKTGGTAGSRTLTFQAKAGSVRGTYFNNVRLLGNNFSLVVSGPTAPVTITAPILTLVKQVDKTAAKPGEVITYTISFKNIGDGAAQSLFIFDTVPFNTTYNPNSLRIGNAGSTYATATPRTDGPGETVPSIGEAEISGTNIIFTITTLAADDGASNSGNDEGKAYFQVIIN